MALTASIITGGSNSHQTTAEEANALATDIISAGVIGTLTNTNGAAPTTGGFAVNAQGTPDTTVAVSTGVCYVTATPTGGSSQKVRVKNNASANVTISANASGATKYDWLYVKIDPDKALNPNVSATDVATLTTSRSSSQTTDNGTPPTYGTLIAVITVANGFSTITNGNITDSRAQSSISSVATVSAGWTSLGSTPATVTANGNRSYSCVFNSVDLTGTLSPGMRLLMTRTVASPTQCTSLNGSTQFYSKTSPAGMTFTNNFVVSAWVKLSAYPVTNDAGIVSRYNGTSGWSLRLRPSGQVRLVGFNAAAANFSLIDSYQSIPLNKWVHIAAQLDMSSFTATPTTSYTMIDGVDVPASVLRGGTNPTALIQAGNLEVGSENATATAAIKIAQAAVYSAKVTQANILATISQGLAGTETSLISAYSFNNTINDLNANANNLSANGSAVATNTDSPFSVNSFGTATGTTDYGIIMTSTFSTNTTLVVQVPEANTIPTTGGVSAVSYATVKTPYGFPGQRGKWRNQVLVKTTDVQTNPVSGTWYNPSPTSGTSGGDNIKVPIGEWMYGYEVDIYGANSQPTCSFYCTLSTANNSETDIDLSAKVYAKAAVSTTTEIVGAVKREKELSLAAATSFYLNLKTDTANQTTVQIGGGQSTTKLYADCAYL